MYFNHNNTYMLSTLIFLHNLQMLDWVHMSTYSQYLVTWKWTLKTI